MAEEPGNLLDTMLDGTESMRVTRKMRNPPMTGPRTGPLKVWKTSILDIIKFARRVSPTVKAVALSATGRLTVTDTADNATDLGVVATAPMLSGDGPPDASVGSPGQYYLDRTTCDIYQKEDGNGVG